jgi:hypothetical protein
MAPAVQLEEIRVLPIPRAEPAYFSIADLAGRWRCSRASVYNRLRGQKVIDFAAPGCRGQKLIARDTVRRIESAHMKVLR